jgi:hypothetical protein
MSTRKLIATASTILLTLAATTSALMVEDASSPPGSVAVSHASVTLAASATDTATTAVSAAADAVNTGAYGQLFSILPTWPTPTVGLDIPGVFNGFDNLFGWVLWNYGLGFSIGNDGPLGIQEWAPSTPFFDVVAESMGTTQGEWPGVASLVGLLTPIGGFSNIESYANYYDPTNSTCLICDTFHLFGPADTNLFSWTTDFPIGQLPQFEMSILGTPLFGTNLGDAFDYSPLANNFDPPAALSSLAVDPTQNVLTDFVSFLGGSANASADLALLLGGLAGNQADLTLLLGNVGTDLAANLSSATSAELAATLPNLLVGLIP